MGAISGATFFVDEYCPHLVWGGWQDSLGLLKIFYGKVAVYLSAGLSSMLNKYLVNHH